MIGQVAQTITNTVTSGSAPPEAHHLSGLEAQRQVGLKAWALLQRAIGTTADLTSISQWRPDFGFKLRADGDARRYLVEAYQLSEEQIERVLASRDAAERSRVFARIEDAERYRVAADEHHSFHNYVIDNGPLLPQPVFDGFVELSKSLNSALITLRIALSDSHVGEVENGRYRANEKIFALANTEVREFRRSFRAGLGIPDPDKRG